MREILFRGKRIDNGEWVEGSLLTKLDVDACCVSTCEIIEKTDYTISCDYDTRFRDLEPISVDGNTVGQYTGLKDKNGERIFEGDVLQGYFYPYFHEPSNTYNYFAEVVWFEDVPAFGLANHKNPQSHVAGIAAGICAYMEEFESSDWVVIGNIHDNPELLKEG